MEADDSSVIHQVSSNCPKPPRLRRCVPTTPVNDLSKFGHTLIWFVYCLIPRILRLNINGVIQLYLILLHIRYIL